MPQCHVRLPVGLGLPLRTSRELLQMASSTLQLVKLAWVPQRLPRLSGDRQLPLMSWTAGWQWLTVQLTAGRCWCPHCAGRVQHCVQQAVRVPRGHVRLLVGLGLPLRTSRELLQMASSTLQLVKLAWVPQRLPRLSGDRQLPLMSWTAGWQWLTVQLTAGRQQLGELTAW